MKGARIPLFGDFSCVPKGDLTGGEPVVFGFVADEGYDGVFFLKVFF